MAELTDRKQLLPDLAELISEGQRLARGATIGRSAFQDHYGVASEADYKRMRAALLSVVGLHMANPG